MNDTRIARYVLALVIASISVFPGHHACAIRHSKNDEGKAGEPYPNMPSIPPIGVRTGNTLISPLQPKGSLSDPAKGYRLQDFGGGLYMITDNQIQSMFLVYDRGSSVMDAPQSYQRTFGRRLRS